MNRLEVVQAAVEEQDAHPAILDHLHDGTEDETDRFLVSLLADPRESLGMRAADLLLSRNPWLKLECRPQDATKTTGSVTEHPEDLRWREIERGLCDFVAVHQDNEHAYIPLTHFPALYHQLVQTLKKEGFDRTAMAFARAVNLDQQCTRTELIFVPTYSCNLSCPYCYAKDWQIRFGGAASREKVVKLLNWARRMGLTQISLAGGEPTVYGEFEFLTQQLAARGMTMTMASNMLYPQRIADLLAPEMVTLVTAHYDADYLSCNARHRQYLTNLTLLQDRQIPYRLRYTLTSTSNRDEWQKIIDLCETAQAAELHFAPTFLNFEASNRDAYGDTPLTRKMESMIEFCDHAISRNIRLVLCKPVPLCCIPEEKRREYLLRNILRNPCVAMDHGYSRNITVNPDLSTFPCNGLAIRGPDITGCTSLREAAHHFRPTIGRLVNQPYLVQCTDCFYWRKGLCQQACLVEKQALPQVL